MKTKFHAASEPIKKLKLIQQGFFPFYPNLQKFSEIAVLAGGAIRDDYMGRTDEIADYDIFIHCMAYEREQIEEVIEKVFPRNDLIEQLFDTDYQTMEEQLNEKGDVKPGSHAQINDVWEVDEELLTYQLIFTRELPRVHVNKYFDIGFCKAYCDGVKIRYTDDFLHDVHNKTLTIVGDDMTEEQVDYAINHHASKIIRRYDDFRVVVPDRYKKFASPVFVTI